MVLPGKLATELARLSDRISVIPLALAGLQPVSQADGSRAFPLVAHELFVADRLWKSVVWIVILLLWSCV